MSLPPAASETRPGDMATAAGTCSATIWRISLPRTARLAYRSPGCSAAISPASRSAQPRYPPPGAASFRPSVKLSPIATKDASPGGCENRLSSIVHPSCQDTPRNLSIADSNDLVGSRLAAARITGAAPAADGVRQRWEAIMRGTALAAAACAVAVCTGGGALAGSAPAAHGRGAPRPRRRARAAPAGIRPARRRGTRQPPGRSSTRTRSGPGSRPACRPPGGSPSPGPRPWTAPSTASRWWSAAT